MRIVGTASGGNLIPPKIESWQVLKDFSPGIRARVTPANVRSLRGEPLGVASADGTYRCCSYPDGSLGPLLGRSNEIVLTTPTGISGIEHNQFAISGMWQAGPLGVGDYEFHIAWGWRNDATMWWRWERIKTWQNNEPDTLIQRSWALNPLIVFLDRIHINPTWFAGHRSASGTDYTQTGLPQVACAFHAGDATQSVWAFWPNALTPSSDTPLTIGLPYWPSIATSHQRRHIILDHRPDPHGSGPGWNHNEDVYYTQQNLQTIDNAGKPQAFGSENTSGYSAMISTSYTELFLLKTHFGGLVIRGQLGDHTALRLPGLPDIGGGSHQHPCVTPIGVVFLTRTTGAWLWGGGEGVEHISGDAVDGTDFIIPYATSSTLGDREIADFIGRMWCFQDWVFLPNNWVWSWKQNNWWRLENPADVKFLWCGPDMNIDKNVCYFSPSAASPGEPAIYEYNTETPAKSYVWTSQPLPLLEERQFKIREVVFVVSGDCTWTFELFNLDGSIETHTFATTRLDRPTYVRENANVTCEELKLRISSTSPTAAGVVHEVRLGIQTDVHLPHGGS